MAASGWNMSLELVVPGTDRGRSAIGIVTEGGLAPHFFFGKNEYKNHHFNTKDKTKDGNRLGMP